MSMPFFAAETVRAHKAEGRRPANVHRLAWRCYLLIEVGDAPEDILNQCLFLNPAYSLWAYRHRVALTAQRCGGMAIGSGVLLFPPGSMKGDPYKPPR